MKSEKKYRALFILIFIGAIYYVLLITTGISIPCVFRSVTGYKCPGCGITTMIVDMVYLNYIEAFKANPFLFITAPLVLAEIWYYYVYRDTSKKLPIWNKVMLVIYLILLLAFGVLRNIYNW